MTPDEKYNDELTNPELEHILSAMKGAKVPVSSRSKEKAWNMLMQSVVEQENRAKVIRFTNAKVWMAVAASVLVIIAIGWSYVWLSRIEKIAPKGYVVDVVLPDGSEVKLNAESRVEYPKYFNIVGRKISMDGEVFFRVNPGKNFTVTDSHGRTVEVLGTEFNVNSRNNVFKVACYSGSVNVLVPETNPVKLTKGFSVDFEDNQLKVIENPIDSINTPTWTIGEFYFQGALLSDVFEELERQFNITITVEGFSAMDRTYTGFFRNSNLTEALDLVALPMGLNYIVSPDSSTVIVKQ